MGYREQSKMNMTREFDENEVCEATDGTKLASVRADV